MDNIEWVAIRKDVNQLVIKLKAYAVEGIERANIRGLQFDTATTKAERCTFMKSYQKHLWPKLTTKIMVGNCVIRFNTEGTWWLGVRMDAHLTLKALHNRCMEMARAAEARLRALTRMQGMVPVRVTAIQTACIPAVALY